MSTTRSKTAKAEADPPNPETVDRTTAYAGDEATVTATPLPAECNMGQILMMMNAMELRREEARERAEARERQEKAEARALAAEREEREEQRRRVDEERWATMFTLSQASAAQNLAQMEQTREQEKKSWTTLFQASQEERRREREEDTAHREARERKRAGRDIPKQAALTDVSDLETFLNSFEGQMQLYDVHPDYWIANLLSLLDPASFRFQEGMPINTKSDFRSVRTALLDFHGITRSHYRVRWRDMEMQAKETCQQLWQRLALTFKAWTKETANKDKLEDLMVKEKLLSLLPPSVQSWVRTQIPDTAAKAARLGDEYILSQPKTEPKKWNSNRLEHPKNAGPRPLYRSDPTTKPEVTPPPSQK